MTETFSAFTAEKTDEGFRRGVTELTLDDLPDGDVVVDVEWSSVNYKDHLASIEKGRVARISPIVPVRSSGITRQQRVQWPVPRWRCTRPQLAHR